MIMKATELRIGNYFDRNGLMEARVISQSGVKLYDHVNKLFLPIFFKFDEFIKGIPLTEEWLLKFGFVMIDHSSTHFWSRDIETDNGNHPDLYVYFQIRDNKIIESGIVSGEIDNEYGYEGERTHLIGIANFVHQLQNLYFALTGEELTPKR